MADADTPLKRFTAMNTAMPFRGLNVLPVGGATAQERRGLLYLYSFGAGAPPASAGIPHLLMLGVG